jgi:hypothetical protein
VHGVLAHHEPFGDLAVRQPVREQAQHLALARRERIARQVVAGGEEAPRPAGVELGPEPLQALSGGRRLVRGVVRAAERRSGRSPARGAPARPRMVHRRARTRSSSHQAAELSPSSASGVSSTASAASKRSRACVQWASRSALQPSVASLTTRHCPARAAAGATVR